VSSSSGVGKLRLEKLALSGRRIADTVTEIYAKRGRGFFMNEDERDEAVGVKLRAWGIRVAARGVGGSSTWIWNTTGWPKI